MLTPQFKIFVLLEQLQFTNTVLCHLGVKIRESGELLRVRGGKNVVGRWTKKRCEGKCAWANTRVSTHTRGDIELFVVLTEDFIEISEPFFRACGI